MVRDQRDALHTLGARDLGDRLHRDGPVDRLAAGHGDGIVVQHLVGDVGVGRDRLADRHRAGMIPGAFAEILEDMALAGEQRGGCPVDAFAAHLDQRSRVAVHPARHEVTADAGKRLRPVGHLGRGVVRTAGTEIGRPGRALDGDGDRRLRGDLLGAPGEIVTGKDAVETLGDDRHQHARRQLAGPRHQPLAVLVALSDHGVRLVARPVIEIFLELALDDAALFLDDQHLLLALHEAQRVTAGERPDHADLVDVDTEFAAFGLADAEETERLHQVAVALAGGDDAEFRVVHVVDVAVDRVGLGEGEHGLLLGLHAFFDLRAGKIGPAVMQAAGRRGEVRCLENAVGLQVERGG